MKLRFITIFLLFAFLSASAIAQSGSGRRHWDPMSEIMREKLVKMKIEEQKKDFDKLVARSELVAKLCEEIETSFSENKKLTDKDQEKLEKVDKLVGKIRKELRVSKTDKTEKTPNTIILAIEHLRENTSKLFKEVKKTTRHSISAVAIQSSNTVLKLVKFLRFGKK